MPVRKTRRSDHAMKITLSLMGGFLLFLGISTSILASNKSSILSPDANKVCTPANTENELLAPPEWQYKTSIKSLSPDGKKLITVKRAALENDSWTKVILSNIITSESKVLYNQKTSHETFNELERSNWSSEGTYFYDSLSEGINSQKLIVFKTQGQPFSTGDCYWTENIEVLKDVQWLNDTQLQYTDAPSFPPESTFYEKFKDTIILDLQKETIGGN